MTPSLTDTLCTRCGLCCDGSLFADVELAGRAEATRVEAMGLGVEDDGHRGVVLTQPCAALRGRLCGVYEHRPKCCRTFECRLLLDVRAGAVSVQRAKREIAQALKGVARVKALIAGLGPRDEGLPLVESCAEALARDTGVDADLGRKHAELQAAMSGVEKHLRRTFLGRDVAHR